MLASSVLRASIVLWALPLLCMRPCMAEPEAMAPCQSGTCEDGVSLMQQSNSLKRRMTTNASENEVVGEEEAPANIDLSPLRNVLKDVVSHRAKDGGDDKPENITIIMSLPNQFPSGLMQPGAPQAPPGMVGPMMMPPGANGMAMPGQAGGVPPITGQIPGAPASSGGVAGAASWMKGASSGSITSSGNAGRNTWGSSVSRKSSAVLPKTTTVKPSGGASYSSGGGNVQASVQAETQAGITAGIKAGILSSQKQITQQIAAGVQQGIKQGIAQGLAQR